MKKTKKILAMACAMALSAAIAVGGTLAYLTSNTDVVTNTFTVGNVTIDLDEAKVTEYGVVDGETRVKANAYKLIPGHEYVKDPTVKVATGSENCWLFVKVENGIAEIEAAADTVKADKTEYATIAEQMTANGWTLVDDQTNIYAYKDVVSAGAEQEVFGEFMISGTADVSTYTGKTITIDAYAVQADGFGTAAEAWAAASTSWN